jgi:hypothetical protein
MHSEGGSVSIPTEEDVALERRWTTYKIRFGKTTELWRSPEEVEQIEASRELRVLDTRDGHFHQYLKAQSA